MELRLLLRSSWITWPGPKANGKSGDADTQTRSSWRQTWGRGSHRGPKGAGARAASGGVTLLSASQREGRARTPTPVPGPDVPPAPQTRTTSEWTQDRLGPMPGHVQATEACVHAHTHCTRAHTLHTHAHTPT
uniref:Uncharacterized protein n=1 Tax=Rousettus aegyptiacus TaxID=9407 RepID=A0A7J8CJ36_ROUAE|nr:hypothetical protein HJG63_009219 [Rousettus aegyptiacus]